VLFAKYYKNDKVEREEMNRAFSTNGKRNRYKSLVGQSERKRPLRKTKTQVGK
jgi:hypothetical protein